MSDAKLAERYLALTRQALTPTPAFRERVQANLQPSPALLGALAPLPSRVDRGFFRLSKRASVAAGGALLALGFLAGYGVRPPAREVPPPPPRLLDTPAELPALLEPDPIEPTLPVEAKPSIAARHGRSRARLGEAAAPVPARGPSDELALLQRAERAVRAENSALALMLAGELDARYPSSELLEERAAIELMAHCVAHATDARSRAERFLRAHPRSVYAERIAQLCLAEAATPASTRD
ncbi:MAG TPA: hypothetical protein VMG12_01560 [Polyangiaceae bacterium]|nr:hypothetical protein [Polyangiaceae bacterium]